MNYINQRSKTSCGPVALYNALIWAGIKKSPRILPAIKSRCRYLPSVGTFYHSFNKTIHDVGKNYFTAKRYLQMDVDSLFRHLRKGKTALFIFKNKKGGHCSFIYGVEDDLCLFSNHSVKKVSYEDMDTLLHQPHVIWILKKR